MTTELFKQTIFNYENNQEWKFEGDRPALIDFYADWCAPCKMIAPILEELSEKYDGKIDIYKVNTEQEQELSSVFGIQSIPSLLFIPKEGMPKMQAGAMAKQALEQAIENELINA
ncbi:thioredoxin [Halosquirtibacter laminarini]|uniref:Thioredoxin n=2 Tax=Halosquirtibacter laminarini TaxID=3374600 RepID=A0AC61NJM2_9BACT|nr:thioredoxin [Prolixibacteraceae bacterium]